MARQSNLADRFAAGLVLCTHHPSRRASGYCESCDADLCRRCALGDHPCRSRATRQRRRPGGWRKPAGLTLAGLLLIGFFLAGRTVGRHAGTGDVPASDPTVELLLRPLTPPGPAASADISTPPGRTAPVEPTARARRPAAVPATPSRAGAIERSPDPSRSRPAEASPPVARAMAASFNRGSGRRLELLLSFDGGSTADGADEILDTLSRAGIRTTFFLTGEFIRDHPDIVRRIVDDGHEVGNHTDTHPHLTTWEQNRRHRTRPAVTRDWLLDQLTRASDAFLQTTGRAMAPLWRAPYGEINDQILGWAAAAGWRHVGWTRSLDSLDWVSDPHSSIYRTADQIAARILSLPRKDQWGGRGAIVLMHLGTERPHQERIARILPRIVDAYRRLGFDFVTASDMIRDS
ncbi:MAG: polysaccharide deacetylase family protein [Acidobacteriota bacterium]